MCTAASAVAAMCVPYGADYNHHSQTRANSILLVLPFHLSIVNTDSGKASIPTPDEQILLKLLQTTQPVEPGEAHYARPFITHTLSNGTPRRCGNYIYLLP
jgi:hypothetical protein